MDNYYYWTEQLFGRIYAQNCASHVVFDWTSGAASTAAAASSAATWTSTWTRTTAKFDGVVFQNGAFVTNGSLKIRGNFGYSTTP